MKKRDVVGDLASPSPSWLFIHFAGFFFFCFVGATKNVTPSAVIEAGVID